MEQRTDEWFEARLGKVTASRIVDVMARIKTGYGASRGKYMDQLLDEIVTGNPTVGFTNAAMQHGIDTEPKARLYYEILTGHDVEEVGFLVHPRIEQSGASPDGLVGGEGMIEIKCPNTSTHRQFLVTEKIERRYMLQMQWQMACADRAWCDFVSFDNRLLDVDRHGAVLRVERDQAMIEEIEHEVEEFIDEMNRKLKQYKELS